MRARFTTDASLFSEGQVDDPTSSDMEYVPSAMIENRIVLTTGVIEGVGKDGEW